MLTNTDASKGSAREPIPEPRRQTSDRRWHAFDSSGSGILILDKAGNVGYCDAGAARLFGASARKLLGQPIAALIPGLPIKASSSGNNVARSSLWAAARKRERYGCVDKQDRSFELDVRLEPLVLDAHHQILLSLRLPERARAWWPTSPQALTGDSRRESVNS